MQTVLAAVAAREAGRPVKLVVPRAGVFHDASFRPTSRHHVRLGADGLGKMVAAIHEVDAQTSQPPAGRHRYPDRQRQHRRGPFLDALRLAGLPS